jgi:DNA primase
VKQSNSQRAYLLRAAQQYASCIDLAKDYLETRGLSVEEARMFHLGVVEDPLPGHEPYKGRLAIPYVTPSGVVDIRFRKIVDDDSPKYLGMPGANTTMFNTNACFQANGYICVTEGELDCVTLAVKTGHPTVGIPGANNWKPHYAKILDDYEIVIVLADGDKAGAEFGKQISREVPNTTVIAMPENEDVNSVIVKLGKEWIDERIRDCITSG